MGSGCYVYAIVGRETPLPPAEATGLAMVPCGELAAVTAWARDNGAPTTMEAVLHHEAIVEAVRQQGPALPVRFGTVFRDVASLASALRERHDVLAADLGRIGDKVEVSVTALWAGTPPASAPAVREEGGAAFAAPGAGARYLRARAAAVRHDDAATERARVIAAELERMVDGIVIESRESLVPTPRVAVRATYLLHPASVDAFRAAFERFRTTHGELHLLLTGPWPPYSFAKRTESEDGGASHGQLSALARLLADALRGRRD